MAKSTTTYRYSIRQIVGIVLGLLLLASTAAAESDIFFPPHSRPFHKTFPRWSAEWWQFVLSFPMPENPLLDSTGEKCAIGQHGPVWFLMGALGGSVERRCSVPARKALFFPVVNLVNVNTNTQTADALRAEIASCFDGVTTLSVEVDGTPIEGLQRHPDRFRVRSVAFDVTLPAKNLFEVFAVVLPSGIYSPAVSDGFYVMLKPLDAGDHLLRIHGESPCGSPFDVTYRLTAAPSNLDSAEAKEEAKEESHARDSTD